MLPGGLLLLGMVGPSRLSRVPSLCVIRRLFGRCPTCGVTRAVAALMRGDTSPRPRRGLGAMVVAACAATIASDLLKVAEARRTQTATPDRVAPVAPEVGSGIEVAANQVAKG